MTEKKYVILEVEGEDCPHGKTIDEMCKEIHYAICVPCTATANDACNKCPVHLGSIEDGLKALLGGEEGK